MESGFSQTHCLAMATPYTKAYRFSEISILPVRNTPCLPAQQISALTVNLIVCAVRHPASVREVEEISTSCLPISYKEVLLGEAKILAGNPLRI